MTPQSLKEEKAREAFATMCNNEPVFLDAAYGRGMTVVSNEIAKRLESKKLPSSINGIEGFNKKKKGKVKGKEAFYFIRYEQVRRVFGINQPRPNGNLDYYYVIAAFTPTSIKIELYDLIARKIREHVESCQSRLYRESSTSEFNFETSVFANEWPQNTNYEKLVDTWAVYFTKVKGGGVYRSFLEFPLFSNLSENDKERARLRRAPVKYVQFRGVDGNEMDGWAMLNHENMLTIELYGIDKPSKKLMIQGCFDDSVWGSRRGEFIVYCIRTYSTGTSVFSSQLILRQSAKLFNPGARFDGLDKQVTGPIKELDLDDTVEGDLVRYLASSSGVSASRLADYGDLEQKTTLNLKRQGRNLYSDIRLNHTGSWIGLSVSDQNHLNQLKVSYFFFVEDDISQQVKVTRITESSKYYGELQYGEAENFWLLLSDKKCRKAICGKMSSFRIPTTRETHPVIYGFTTFTNGGLRIGREIIIPESLMPAKYQEINFDNTANSSIPFRIEFSEFKDLNTLHSDIKSYLSNQREGVIGYPPIESTPHYRAKEKSSLYQGKYLLFFRDPYHRDGSLFQLSLSINSLGTASLHKMYPSGMMHNNDIPVFYRYLGECKLVNQTISISMEHVGIRSVKDLTYSPPKHQQRQDLLLTIHIPFLRKKEYTLVGQMADTDVDGYPDCNPCIAICLDNSEEVKFGPAYLTKDSVAYRKLSNHFVSFYKKAFSSRYFGKELKSLDDFFDEMRSLHFHDYRNKDE